VNFEAKINGMAERKSTMTNNQKKDWAKLLFLNDNATQKEIALRVGVTEKTVSSWVNKEDWEQLKSSVIITKSEELKRIYMQINEINTAIFSKEKGQRFASTKEADILSKLTAAARSLETETSVSDVIEVFKRFLNWLREVDLDKAKDLVILQDAFVKSIMK
jgi:transposase-like protein